MVSNHTVHTSAKKMLGFLVFLCVCLAEQSNGQVFTNTPDSPCPELFRYQHDGNEWYGLLEIPYTSTSQTIKLNVLLSLKAQLTTSYVGVLELFATRETALREIQQRRNILYRIRFPIQSPLATLKQIMVSGRVICTGPGEYGGYITEIRLEHTFYTDLPQSQFASSSGSRLPQTDIFFRPQQQPTHTTEAPPPPVYQPYVPIPPFQPEPVPQQPVPQQPVPQQPVQQLPTVSRPTQQTRPTQSFAQPQAIIPDINLLPIDISHTDTAEEPVNTLDQQPIDNTDCGRPASRFGITPLIVGGQTIPRGTWPWLAAVYINKATGLSFNCGGNLVSTKVVITAAHCFRTPEREYYASDVIVYLGRYNIMKWSEKGSHVTEVESIYVHADYMKEDQSFDADVAVVVMTERVQYNDFIRPICLWEGSDNLNDIVGSSGTVVGWGRDGSGNVVTPEPKKISVPIVSDAVCLRSSDTYRYITSKRTFCAGRRNGFGPCNGDSGSGMAIHKNNRIYLRGIVSAALADPVMNTCNLKEFVVFTDAAKFGTWIRSFMQL